MNTKSNFITLDEKTMSVIEEKFQFKKDLAKEREKELFNIFDENLTKDEEISLKYLFAYMPLNDLADYDGDLFLQHVKKALYIQSTVSWGEKIPSSIFLHFILPYRVNNENIEDFRGILFDEIYPRVKDLSMEEAILETNHWCHEKANYIGNDRRTVSPLTLIRTALGRCGEQSTLAVAALRSIGIPARQVYTPLWAHSDSNHAWVEAWADGNWHFFGACEPEPRLNQGWFQNPAKRAMLIHTRVHANYTGPEEVTIAHPWYSELNLTNLYAETKTIKVFITDENGQPEEAKVQFQLFNYGALRPIITMDTDEKGSVEITLGLGDIFISAVGKNGWGFAKCDVRKESEVHMKLTKEFPLNEEIEFKMVPPIDDPDHVDIQISEQEQEIHKERVRQGVEVRTNYENTFIQEEEARKLAAELSLPSDRVWKVLENARGNSHEIAKFLKEYSSKYDEWSLKLLEVLNEKDLTDTFIPTLAEHLEYAMKIKEKSLQPLDDELFAKYILRPRVHFEMIIPYRSFFLEQLGEENVQQFIKNPMKLVKYLNEEFEVVQDFNFYQGSATPVGSYQIKKGDPLSRDILFVAIARSIGIPARLAPTDRQVQIYQNGQWENVYFKNVEAENIETDKTSDQVGTVRWELDHSTDEKISYMKNFSIDEFHQGTYEPRFYKINETGDEKLEMSAGQYRLTTSTRLSDGTALICLRYFEVKPNEEVTVPVKFPKDMTEVPVIAEGNLNVQLRTTSGESIDASNRTGEKGATFIWIEPDREPSKHLLRELREMKNEWEALNIKINCFVTEEKWEMVHELESAGDLPNNLSFFKELNDFSTLLDISKHIPPNTLGSQLPVVCVFDEHALIRYTSEGYKLGISNDVFNIYKQIE